jgi:hypothetical protein
MNPKQARVRGWVLVFLGTFLIVLMGGLSVIVARIIAGSKNPEATTRFTGHATDALYMYGVFSLVLMFGAVAVVSGVSEIRHGKIDRRQLIPVLWICAALFVFGELLLLVF